MINKTLKSFKGMRCLAQTKPQNNRPLVNYVWVNKQKSTINPSDPVCAIEMANIQRAVENANKYPKADFQIWIDKNLLDDYSVFCLESFIKDRARFENIRLQNLQNIPDYADDRYFVPMNFPDESNRTGPRNVYSRADYARILALDYSMKKWPERTKIIYSDMDCPDILLSKALPVMKRYGLAVYDFGEKVVSNGYIGISAHRKEIKGQFNKLKLDARTEAHKDHSGYRAFETFLEKLGMPIDQWHTKIGLPFLLPPVGWEIGPIMYAPPKRAEFLKRHMKDA